MHVRRLCNISIHLTLAMENDFFKCNWSLKQLGHSNIDFFSVSNALKSFGTVCNKKIAYSFLV